MDINFTLVSHCIFLTLLFISFIYGVSSCFKKKGAAYLKIVTCAVGSMMLGELFILLMRFCNGDFFDGFNIGMLGTTGCFFFTWSLAFGQIDSLGDDRTAKFKKYRIIALFQPLIFVGFFVADLFSDVETAKIILNAVLLIPMAMTSYYSLKHLILPDVQFGIFDTMRKYNICLLFIGLLCGVNIILNDYGFELATDIVRIVIAIDFVILIPVTKEGVRKWFS